MLLVFRLVLYTTRETCGIQVYNSDNKYSVLYRIVFVKTGHPSDEPWLPSSLLTVTSACLDLSVSGLKKSPRLEEALCLVSGPFIAAMYSRVPDHRDPRRDNAPIY